MLRATSATTGRVQLRVASWRSPVRNKPAAPTRYPTLWLAPESLAEALALSA
jgi:hypothetical protein